MKVFIICLFYFLGIGFETTAPTIAALIMEAKEKGLKNLSVLSFCKTMPAAFDLILSDKDMYLDGFLCPGHVTAVTGVQLYEPLIKAGKAAVVAGFEPVEMLDAVYEIVKPIIKAAIVGAVVSKPIPKNV